MNRICLLGLLFTLSLPGFVLAQESQQTSALDNEKANNPGEAISTLSDKDIIKTIKNKIATNPTTVKTKVSVTSIDGKVILSGTVDTNTQADEIIQMSSSTEGVKNVNTDEFQVKSSEQPLSDSFITAKIKGLFLREKLFTNTDIPFWEIKVDTRDGIVYLAGTADSKEQAANAVKLAKEIDGVKQVNSSISILKKQDKSSK